MNFDANTTTPIHAAALDTMNQAYRRDLNFAARQECLDDARVVILNALGADVKEWDLQFTSGGTEANFIALSAPLAADGNIRGILVSAAEHSSVLNMKNFAQFVPVEVLPVLPSGTLDLGALVKRVNGGRYLLSIAHANGETGVMMPVKEAARMVKRDRGLVHVDASQTAGRIDIVDILSVADLVTISAHKFGGPVGVGALLARRSVKMTACKPASETANVPAVLGMALALEANLKSNFASLLEMRKSIETLLGERFGARVIGGEPRLSNTLCVIFNGASGTRIASELAKRGFSVMSLEGSHVLEAMGVDSTGAIRISLSYANRPDQIEMLLAALEVPGTFLRDDASISEIQI